MFDDPTSKPDLTGATPRDTSTTETKPFAYPDPSVASRQFSFRSRSSLRGRFVEPRDRRVIAIESHIEKDVALVLNARSDVLRVDEQPAAVAFLDPEGRPGQITFDFRVTLTDGRRVLVAVKDEAHAVKHDVAGFLRHVAPQISPEIADGVMLITERSLSPAMKSNARLIQAVRRDPPDPADGAILDLLPHIQGRVRIGDLVAATPYRASAFRAIVRLIARRTILLTADERISHRSLVIVASNHGEAA